MDNGSRLGQQYYREIRAKEEKSVPQNVEQTFGFVEQSFKYIERFGLGRQHF